MLNFTGKRILVAGCATGIGAATARLLARQGAKLFLGDINETGVRSVAADIEGKGGSAKAFYLDIGDAASVESFVAAAADYLGGLDGVANVAANMSKEAQMGDVEVGMMDAVFWQRTLTINLIGYALVAKHALPHLIEAGGGAIVNTSSITSWMGESIAPAYAASKAGVNALTRHLASAYGGKNVRANAVSPGLVMSEAVASTTSEEEKIQALEDYPLPRLGEPEDIARTIAFLLSDDSNWVTGQVWSVNGGYGFRD